MLGLLIATARLNNEPPNMILPTKRTGRKPLADNMRPVTLRLSPEHIAVFKVLGDGQVNRGIRKAADLATFSLDSPLKHGRT